MGVSHDLGGGFFYRRYTGQDAVHVGGSNDGLPMEFWEAFDAGKSCGITLWRKRDRPMGDDDPPDAEADDIVGGVPLTGPKAWTVVQREPLTLTPSILCQPANIHGHIRNGRWEPC